MRGEIGRDEVRIFFAFLLIFTIFIHWGGTNAWSRFDLTRSIVEDQSLDISNYSHNTMDKRAPAREFWSVVGKERYVNSNASERMAMRVQGIKEVFDDRENNTFTDKAPLSSFLAVPAYIAGDLIADEINSQRRSARNVWIDRGITSSYTKISFDTALKQFLITFTVSSFFGAMLMVLLYRELTNFVSTQVALFTTVIAGAGTPLLYYSTSFFGVVTAAFFGFASYIFLKRGLEENMSRYIYIAGIFSAFAFSTAFYAGLIPVILIGYVLLEKKNNVVFRMMAGLLIGAIPLFIYNYGITGNPLLPLRISAGFVAPGPIKTACQVYSACHKPGLELFGFSLQPFRSVNALFRLLFLETRGLFFYSPVLLLSLPGIYNMYKRDKSLLLISPGIFLALLLLQSSHINWLAGVSFGPRYALVGLPFLMLPVALGMKEVLSKGRIMKLFVLTVFLISVFNSILGLQVLPLGDVSSKDYDSRFNSFSAVQPEFYDQLLDKFSMYGPRSEIMMSVLGRHKGLDITYRAPYGPEFVALGSTGDEFILMSTNFLPLILVAGILLGLFWPGNERTRFSGIAMILLLFAASITISSIHIKGEEYRDNDSSMEFAENITIMFRGSGRKIPYMEVDLLSHPNENTNLTIKVNGERREYIASGGRLYFPMRVGSGKTTVRLESSGCWVPALHLSSSDDMRCLSISVPDVGFEQSEELNKSLLLQGWHTAGEIPAGGTWMRKRAILAVKSNGGSKILKINITPIGQLKNKTLKIEIGGKKFLEKISTDSPLYLPVETVEGWTQVSMNSGACIVPSKISNSTDRRCLSYRLHNISVISAGKNTEIYGSGWYDAESRVDKSWRWMRNYSNYVFYSDGNKFLELEAEPYSKLSGSSLLLKMNGRTKTVLDFNDSSTKRVALTPERGLSRIKLISTEDCLIPAEVEQDSDDTRCLSFRIKRFELKGRILEEGWHPGPHRWMKKKGVLKFPAKKGLTKINVVLSAYDQINGSVTFFVNDERVTELQQEKGKINYSLVVPTEKRINSMRIVSNSGCMVPAEIERGSDDRRCISFSISEFSAESYQK